MTDKKEYDVFKAIEKIKSGDKIEVEVYGKGLHQATVNRVYRVGQALYFDLTIEYEVEKLFGGKKTVYRERTFDYSDMIRNLVSDKS